MPLLSTPQVQESKDAANGSDMRPPDVPRGRKKSRVEDLKEEDEMLRRDLIKVPRARRTPMAAPCAALLKILS